LRKTWGGPKGRGKKNRRGEVGKDNKGRTTKRTATGNILIYRLPGTELRMKGQRNMTEKIAYTKE